ncbi:MAG TPA: uroporphyrinogen decarboxylase family protein [Phycisphaerae bacterium]|nr:uroporphyrinogen decarboxylase family protein [Phycisphaerae bacterium]HOQ87490.1 uroporphyrinogen decarboxylase family protein [Phycisphaerae bacterium]
MSMLDHLPKPDPDVERLKTVFRNAKPDRVPLFELAIAEEVLAELNGQPLMPLPPDPSTADLRAWAAQRVMLWHRLGYDYYRVRVDIPFVRNLHATADTAVSGQAQRQWADEGAGVIQTREDFERYPWPTRRDLGFASAEATLACLPSGMQAIGFSGGVLEWATALMGLESFMLALHDEPDLVRDVVDRVGQIILEAFEVFSGMPEIFALWLGDDMGFKTSTLISPQHLREYILPWHARYADLAHRTGRFFLLHSCGHVDAVMPDLIETVHMDAKHSFEDVIMPVERFKERWGSRVAVLGGVDVDLLSRATPERIRERTRAILDRCGPAGGYACGSGNSVANYVPAAHYLAMVETVHQWNGRL